MVAHAAPAGMPPGQYRVVVQVPNNVGNPDFTRRTYATNFGPVIQVVPPSSTVFRVTSEEFRSIDETSDNRLN